MQRIVSLSELKRIVRCNPAVIRYNGKITTITSVAQINNLPNQPITLIRY